MVKMTEIKLNRKSKEEIRELLKDGFYIRDIEAVDVFNHMERDKDIKVEYIKQDASQYFDEYFCDKDAKLYRDSQGRLICDDIMAVKFEVKQKSEIEQTVKSINKNTKSLLQAKERKSKFEEELIKAQELEVQAKREYESKKKVVTRANSKGKATNKQIKERENALEKYKKAKLNTTKIENKLKSNNEGINKLQNVIESWSNKENKIYGNDVKTTDEMRELAYEQGLEINKTTYSKELEKDLGLIESEYKKSKNIKKLKYEHKVEIDSMKQELINSRQKEVYETIEIYEKCPVTSSSQRQGKTIFIRNKVAENGIVIKQGINDRIMDNMTFGAYSKAKQTDEVVDIVSLDTVASLPQSSRIGYTNKINLSKEILVLEEVACEVSNNVAEVYLDKNGEAQVRYISKENGGKDINNLFDGQSEADKTLFPKADKSTMLLRQRGFKSNAINTNVQEALKDRYKIAYGTLDGYDEAYRIDAYGRKIYLKDVKLITTDSSTKIDKLAELITGKTGVEGKGGLFEEWVKSGDDFSIVKFGGKHSKYGENQRASYQITNTINFGKDIETAKKNMEKFVTTSVDQINLMKNSDEHYLDFLKKNVNEMNIYQVELDMLAKNSNYAKTPEFKNAKSKILSKMKDEIKSGKFLLPGDNLQVAGNPIAMLDHAIGVLPVEKRDGKLFLIKEKYINEFGSDKDVVNVYTKRFANAEKLVHARSPHSNEASFVLSENVSKETEIAKKIDKYFNIDDTVCFIDNTNHASQSALGGQDFDSDINLITNDETLYKMVKENSWGKTYTTVNKVPNSKAKYKYTAQDRAYKDILGANNGIGDVANLTQIVQSQLTHAKYVGTDKDIIKKMEDDLQLLTNATNISIDNVKRPSELALFDTFTKEGLEKYSKVKSKLSKIDAEYRTLSKKMKEVSNNIEEYNKLKAKRDALNKTELNKELSAIRKNKDYIRKGLLSKVQSRKYYIKDKKNKIIKPDFFKYVSQASDVKTKKMKCNMDILSDIIEKEVKVSTKDKSIPVDKILAKQGDDYDTRRIKTAIKKIEEANKTIDGYRGIIRTSSDDEAKPYYSMLQDVESKLKRDLVSIKLNKDDMLYMIRSAHGLTKTNITGIRGLVLRSLYNKDKDMFLDCFEEGDSLLPYSDKMCGLADKTMDEAHEIATDLIEKLNNEQDKLVKKLSKNLQESMMEDDIDETLDRFNEELSNFTTKANNKMTEVFKDIITDVYARTLYNQCQALGINITFGKMSEKRLNIMLNEPFVNNIYNKRMENNMDEYSELIRKVIVDGYKEGKPRWTIVKELEELTGYSKKALDRLVRTETTNFSNRATMQGYKEAGIDKYIFLATLDKRTSSLCRELDGKVFEREKAEIGVNMPPMHPYCRSTTIAYYNDDVLKKMKRRARGKDGKNYELDSFITYEEWAKTNIK